MRREPVLADRSGEWPVRVVAPLRQQGIEARWIDHGARDDMSADFRALFHDDDAEVCTALGGTLLDADSGSEPGRPGAHDHHIKIHRFPRFPSHRGPARSDMWRTSAPLRTGAEELLP